MGFGKKSQNLKVSKEEIIPPNTKLPSTVMEDVKEIDFNEILEKHVGGWGRYQWQYLFVFALVTMELSYVTYSPVLFLYVPDEYWCSAPPELGNLSMEAIKNLSLPFDAETMRPSQCKMYDVNYTQVLQSYLDGDLTTGNESWPLADCKHGWNYDLTDYFRTVPTDMNWVCEEAWKGSFSQSLFFVGATIGTLAFGWISDHYGRYRSFMMANFLLMVTGVATPFCADLHEIAFFAIRFVMGLSHNAYLMSFYMLVLEYVSNDKRALVGNLSLALWLTLGGVYQPWLIKALGEWKTFHIILYVQTAFVFCAPLFVDESCRWLMSQGRVDESVKIIKHIAKINKRTVPDEVYIGFRNHATRFNEREQKKTYTWLDLFKTPRLRKNTLLMIATWMLISLAFDGHVRNIANLNYSLYITFSISILLEFPADLLAIWCLNNLGRRWSASLSLALSSLAMLIVAFLLGNDLLSMIVAMLGRFFVTFAMNAGAQISLEVCPTELRGQGSGLANVFAQASTFFSPYIVYSSTIWEPFPYILLAIIGVLGSTTAIFLPETAGVDLPATIEEAETFGLGQSFFYVPVLHDKLAKKKKEDESVQDVSTIF